MAPTSSSSNSSPSSPVPTAFMTDAPSVRPTRSNANRNNSIRDEAHFLELSGVLLSAPLSSLNLVEEYTVTCGQGISLELPTIGGPVTLIVCGDVVLEAFTGQECFYPQRQDLNNNEECSSRSWHAEENTGYYLLVTPNTSNNEDQDDDATFSLEIVANDKCEYAHGPVAPTSSGVALSYTTLNANPDTVGNCRGASAATAPGVWYLVQGTGQAITASTCSNNDAEGATTDFDTQLSVFSGQCDNLVCIDGNNNFCGGQSSVSWQSTQGEIYRLLVHGANNSTGTFSLTLTTDAVRVANDFCGTATEIRNTTGPSDVLDSSSFWGATADAEVPSCWSIRTDCSSIASFSTTSATWGEFPLGVWYTFQGTGADVFVDLSDNVEHRLEVRVFSGDCGDLQCVNDAISGIGGPGDGWCGAQYAIMTQLGETYYVLASPASSTSLGEDLYMTIDARVRTP
ncbi:CHU large protein [Seminavis robusta]|uniref:CHU large protein n=1 Tax=Seminavis robusta TaxID=568900 RepID=A0A9N8EJP9_9STRA|nr:CHU large protein [Seminavis robusta]|eukprot:Sro1067_g237450.1 CHU large protein (456) ;mRNA; r:36126-38121